MSIAQSADFFVWLSAISGRCLNSYRLLGVFCQSMRHFLQGESRTGRRCLL